MTKQAGCSSTDHGGVAISLQSAWRSRWCVFRRRRTHASTCYPFATRPDFGVAAYANNHDEIGITCILEVRDVVNPKRTWVSTIRQVGRSLTLETRLTFTAVTRYASVRLPAIGAGNGIGLGVAFADAPSVERRQT